MKMNSVNSVMRVVAVVTAIRISIMSAAPLKRLFAVGRPSKDAQIPLNRNDSLCNNRVISEGRVTVSIA